MNEDRFMYCYGNDDGLHAQDCQHDEPVSAICLTCRGRIPPKTTYLAIGYKGHYHLGFHIKCALELGTLLENFAKMEKKYNPPTGSKNE